MPAVLVRPGQPLSASGRQGLLVRPPFPAKAAQAQGSRARVTQLVIGRAEIQAQPLESLAEVARSGAEGGQR